MPVCPKRIWTYGTEAYRFESCKLRCNKRRGLCQLVASVAGEVLGGCGGGQAVVDVGAQ